MAFSISVHAAERFVERVNPSLTVAEARTAIRAMSHSVEAAINFNCKCVRLACGARLIIDPVERQVVTVYPAKPKIHSLQHSGRGIDFSATRRKAKHGEQNDAMD